MVHEILKARELAAAKRILEYSSLRGEIDQEAEYKRIFTDVGANAEDDFIILGNAYICEHELEIRDD